MLSLQMLQEFKGSLGNTPLIQIEYGGTQVSLKMERSNPSGSIKDRTAYSMVQKAINAGQVTKNSILADASSGSFGVSLASIASRLGLKSIILSPETINPSKLAKIQAFGGEVWTIKRDVAPEHPESYSSRLQQIRSVPHILKLDQMSDEANPLVHEQETGPELWRQTKGQLDTFLCGIGTGGTLTGLARFLKKLNPRIRIIGVDAEGSVYRAFFHKETPPPAKIFCIDGVGDREIAKCADLSLVDEIITVTDNAAYEHWKILVRNYGLSVGPSTGLAMAGLAECLRHRDLGSVAIISPDDLGYYLEKFQNKFA